MIRAGIVGATGYTGFETIRWLSRHPQVALAFATARSDAGKPLAALYPTPLPLVLERLDAVDVGAVDVLFLALPHAAAAEVAVQALEANPHLRLIDLSADFRLRDAAEYEQWYHHPHPAPALLAEAVYGLTEWAREALRGARLVANPGCYPTSILLALAPLLRAGLLEGVTVIADSKSGTSGAGRAAKVGSLFAEVNENLAPYSIGHSHRHVAELEQEMARLGGARAARGLLFSPHLLPVTRGILSTIYLPLPQGWSAAQLRALYEESYADEPFVWLLPSGQTATLAHTVHSNRCALSLHPVPERDHLIVVSTIDNLVKGAAGQAIQNMNVMFGLQENLGLA